MIISVYTCNPHEVHMSEEIRLINIKNEKFYYLMPVSEKYREYPFSVQKCQGILIPVNNVSNISFYSDEDLKELKDALSLPKEDLKKSKGISAVG